jgi:hypothetical protein
MKSNNPMVDNLIETQNRFMNNWFESAKKMQTAFNANQATEGQNLYKEFVDRQMDLMNNYQKSMNGLFGRTGETNPVEFFRNWFTMQGDYARQMADFQNQAQNTFGKTTGDIFGQNQSAFSNIYNSWLNTLNTSYESLNKNMKDAWTRDAFSKFMEGSQIYAAMQEYLQPMIDTIQKGKVSAEDLKSFFTPEKYNALTRKMFGGLYTDSSLQEIYDSSVKRLKEFFTVNNNMGHEYFEQLRKMSAAFTDIHSNGAMASVTDLYGKVENLFGRTFEPLMNVVNPGKEKENAENLISLLDKLMMYSFKQAELQTLLQDSAKKSIEAIARKYSEKYSNNKEKTELPKVQDLFNDWVKVNEEVFTHLFSTDEFSRLKAENLNLSLELKKYFEHQFEQNFNYLPVVFKSEIEELQKTVYTLRKQVKELKAEMQSDFAGASESKSSKNSRKK